MCTPPSPLLAIGWEPELRGILIVIIAVGVLWGSVYLVLATNLGARLGFLVALAALVRLAGPSWASSGGSTASACRARPVVGGGARPHGAAGHAAPSYDVRRARRPGPTCPTARRFSEEAGRGGRHGFVDEGWEQLDSVVAGVRPGAVRRPACSLEEVGAFAAGEFQVINVFDMGGERYPKLFGDSLDFLAFFHEPHYVVVEVAPIVPHAHRAGPGSGRRPDRRRRASASTCTWSATSAPADSRRGARHRRVDIFLTLC